MTQNVKKPSRFAVASRIWAALLLLGGGIGLGSAGCSSEDCTGDECKTCSDSDCAAGQRCVQKECRASCNLDADDCPGGQVCHGYQFSSGEIGNYCVVVPGAVVPSGRFSPCESSAECDEAHGFSCLDGECNYACRTHADCVEVGHCDARFVDGQQQSFCVHDAAPPEPGKLYTACPGGNECADSRLCLGAGVGDLDAYCSIDCSGDDDCAAGYYCGTITRSPCEDACPSAGADKFRGQPMDPRCVPPELIGQGQPYQCGDLGIVRSVCRQREFCSPCSSDADCLAVPNQVCAQDESGEKICTKLCDTGSRSCPWGNAARCANFDADLGVPTCSHRFGSCHGSGETCEPCRGDSDCPGGVCASSQFTGERWCINLGTRCTCEQVDAAGTCNDGGCPDSPGGLTVMCIGDPSSGLANTCYAANSSSDSQLGASPQTGCWGPN